MKNIAKRGVISSAILFPFLVQEHNDLNPIYPSNLILYYGMIAKSQIICYAQLNIELDYLGVSSMSSEENLLKTNLVY